MTVTDRLYLQMPHTLTVHIGSWEGEQKVFRLFIEHNKCYFIECDVITDKSGQSEYFRKNFGKVLFLERGETLTDMFNKMQHTLASYDISEDHCEFILNDGEITFYKGYDRKPMTKAEAEAQLKEQ